MTDTNGRATLSIKSRPKAGGSVSWFLWIRRPRPERDTLVPVPGFTKLSDRAAVEAFAKPYRAALRKGLSEPRPEDCSGWFDRYVKVHGELGNGTKQHAGDWKRYVAPTIGTKRMLSVTPEDIKAIRDGLTRARLDGKISAKRALNIWSTVVKAPFSRAFTDDDPKYASVRVGAYAANPAHDGIKPPVSRDDCSEDERERQALEPSEGLALLACDAIPVETRRFYAWAMLTGLRPAELYGLTWADVRDRVIKVQRGRDMKSGDDGDTKTRASVRDVPIHPHLEPLVKAMRGQGRVFPVARVRDVEAHAGELRGHLALAGITRPELTDGTATLRPFDVRSFRTTFATWCAASGFDSAWIDVWLGHAPKTTTAKHYVKSTGAMTSGVFPELPQQLSAACEPRVTCKPEGSLTVEKHAALETVSVRRKGLEPLQELPHRNLNPARLPIPPPSLLVSRRRTLLEILDAFQELRHEVNTRADELGPEDPRRVEDRDAGRAVLVAFQGVPLERDHLIPLEMLLDVARSRGSRGSRDSRRRDLRGRGRRLGERGRRENERGRDDRGNEADLHLNFPFDPLFASL